MHVSATAIWNRSCKLASRNRRELFIRQFLSPPMLNGHI
jgi:hypothetical protein